MLVKFILAVTLDLKSHVQSIQLRLKLVESVGIPNYVFLRVLPGHDVGGEHVEQVEDAEVAAVEVVPLLGAFHV